MHGAHGKPLQIAGKTQHLDIQWGEAPGRASFIVIVGLELLPCLIRMDIMRPLRVHIDVTNGTATPAQPDRQTVHLNAAQSQQRHQEKQLSQATGSPPAPPPQGRAPLPEAHSPVLRHASPSQIPQPQGGTPSPRALLSPGGTADSSPIQPQRKEMPLPGARISAPPPRRFLTQPPLHPANPRQVLHCRLPHRALPPLTPLAALGCSRQQTSPPPPVTARLVRCHNPWPTEDVLFCPNDALPAFVTPRDGSPRPLPKSVAYRGRPFLP